MLPLTPSTQIAEGAGFEPADPIAEVGGLANRWFKPLTQPSYI